MTTLAQIKEATRTALNNINSAEDIKSLTFMIRAYNKEVTGSQYHIDDRTLASIGLQIATAMSEVLSIPNPKPGSFKSFFLQLTELTEQELAAYNYGFNDSDINSCVTITKMMFYQNFPNMSDLMLYVHGVIEASNRAQKLRF